MATRALCQTSGTLIPIGHSMGGMVALDMWRQAPKRIAAIALFGVVGDADTKIKNAGRNAILARMQHTDQSANTFREMIETVFTSAYFAKPKSVDMTQPQVQPTAQATAQATARAIVADMALAAGTGVFAAQSAALMTRQAAWAILPDIVVPCLVARGSLDTLCNSAQQAKMCALLPTASRIVIPNSGHFAPLESPGEVAHTLCNWLSSAVLNRMTKSKNTKF